MGSNESIIYLNIIIIDMTCSKCRIPINLGHPYYEWSCGHIMPQECFGLQVFTETGIKCPICSSMMTRQMYEQWCLQGFTQYYLSRAGFQFACLSTAPVLPNYRTIAPLHDLSRFQPLQPFQVTDNGVQCTLSSRVSSTSTPRQFYSQFCRKRTLAKKQ